MIVRFSQLLRELQLREKALLDQQGIKHGPTIGAMYEGLTRQVLNLAMPKGVNLRLVDGFVCDSEGNLSRQLDCMLVRGIGSRIPHTDSYIWPIQNVLAVFEIKKRLYGQELIDSYGTLGSVVDRFKAFDRLHQIDDPSVGFSFAALTGRTFKPGDGVQSEVDLALLRSLKFDRHSPIRVVFGYDGFVDEHAFREGFSDLTAKIFETQIPVSYDFPNLVVCGHNSIIKLNGEPYFSPMADEYWPVIASSPTNPLLLLLEMLVSRIERLYPLSRFKEVSFEQPTLHPLMKLRYFIAPDGLLGCHYATVRMSRAQLAQRGPEWMPFELNCDEWALLRISQEAPILQDDPKLLEWLERRGQDIERLISKLLEHRLIAIDGKTIVASRVRYFSSFVGDRIFTVHAGDSDRLDRFIDELYEHKPSLKGQPRTGAGAYGLWCEIAGQQRRGGKDLVRFR